MGGGGFSAGRVVKNSLRGEWRGFSAGRWTGGGRFSAEKVVRILCRESGGRSSAQSGGYRFSAGGVVGDSL